MIFFSSTQIWKKNKYFSDKEKGIKFSQIFFYSQIENSGLPSLNGNFTALKSPRKRGVQQRLSKIFFSNLDKILYYYKYYNFIIFGAQIW